MSTLQQLIDQNQHKCIDVTDSIQNYRLNCVSSGMAIMDDNSQHLLNEDKWSLVIPNYDLAVEKEKAKNLIDETAGATRTKYVTDIPCQSATYLRKENHAKAFKDDGYPEADINNPKYRYIKGEIEASDVTITGRQASDLILATAEQWDALNKIIECERLRGKIHVKNSVDLNGVISARDAALEILRAL